MMPMLTRTHPDDADVDPNSSCWCRCWPELLQGCWSELLWGWWQDVLRGCWQDVDPNSCQTALRTRPERVLSTYRSVAVISYTRRTQYRGHCSHRSHRGHHSHRRPLSGWVRLRREEASESFASWNRRPESVGCPDPGCVHNASGTLLPRSYEGSRSDCYRSIVVENGIRMVVAPGLITCCDEPVETIDWLSLSLSWHVAYIVAASPNPQPRDDVLHKGSI